jgi:hypothetical protein
MESPEKARRREPVALESQQGFYAAEPLPPLLRCVC